MSSDATKQLDGLISEGQSLLDNYKKSKDRLKNSPTELGESIISEMAGALVADLFSSRRIGSKARRISHKAIKDSRKAQLNELKRIASQQVETWINKSTQFLHTISTLGVAKPNSHRLVSQFSKIQDYVKPDTKLKHGIQILKKFKLNGVVRNDELTNSVQEGLIARPGEEFKAYNRILNIASQAKGYLLVADPYPGPETLIVLEKCPPKQSGKLLTYPPRSTSNRAEFETLSKKLMKDHPEIEVRYAPHRTLHDRFIITATEAWHVGHSIKDIGNKLSAITPMDANRRKELKLEFDKLWNQADLI